MDASDTVHETASAAREIPVEFRGTGSEYFRIWIVNLLLTVVTLGIYSAWAKVRRLRYFYGSTSLDGASFEYHGQPLAILKGRLIAAAAYALFYVGIQLYPLAVVLFVPLFIFGVPWIIVQSRRFQMRMSSWRGLRFSFHGRYGGAMAAFVGWPILSSLTLGLLWPIALWKQVAYVAGNTAYGNERMRFTATRSAFYAFCFIAGLIFFFAFTAMSLSFAAAGLQAAGEAAAQGGPPQDPAQQIEVLRRAFGSFQAIACLAVGAATLLLAIAYYRRSLANETFSNLHVGPHRLRCTMSTSTLAGIYITNFVAMIFTLGLFYPWAKVRQMRYQLEQTTLLATGDLESFTAGAGQGADAVGEEIGDFFDVDFGF